MRVMKFNKFISESEIFHNITENDIIECIKNKGVIKAKYLKNNQVYDSDTEIKPLNYDNGEIEVEYNGDIYYVSLEDVIYLNFW